MVTFKLKQSDNTCLWDCAIAILFQILRDHAYVLLQSRLIAVSQVTCPCDNAATSLFEVLISCSNNTGWLQWLHFHWNRQKDMSGQVDFRFGGNHKCVEKHTFFNSRVQTDNQSPVALLILLVYTISCYSAVFQTIHVRSIEQNCNIT